MTTSADPSRLERFVAEASTSRIALTSREQEVRATYLQFMSSGSVSGATFAGLDALPRLVESMEVNERFVTAIKDALLSADSSHRSGAITVADTAIAQQLERASLSDPPAPILLTSSELLGFPPTSGFVDDPVCTANGNFVHVETDLDFPERSAVLDVVRTYNALGAHRDSSFGKGWSSPFDTTLSVDNDIVNVTLPDGAVVRFDHDGDKAYRSISRPHLFVQHDRGDWLVRDSDDLHWVFDTDGALIARRVGRTCVRYHRDMGRVIRCDETASGRTLDISWDGSRVVAITSSDGRAVSYHYENDHLVEVNRPAGGFTYRIDDGRISEIHDADGILIVGNVYDEHGRVARQHSSFGRISLYTYGDSGITVATDTKGAARNAFVHDERGNLTAMIDAKGHALRLSYDPTGNLCGWIDRRGHQWTAEWDGDKQTTQTGPLGLWERWHWDSHGRLLAYEAPAGITSFAYTAANRTPTTVTHPGEILTTIEVDDRDLPVIITDPDGVRTEITWDADGQPVSIADAFGNATTCQYDIFGRLRELRTPSSLTIAYETDEAGRVTIVKTSNAQWEREWSTAGRAIAGRDPIDGEWQATHSSHGAVEQIVNARGTVTAFEYDSFGNISKATGSDGRIYLQHHDGLGQLTSTIDPAGSRWDYRFDPEGALVEITSPDGTVRKREVDALGRTTREVDEHGQVWSRFWSDKGLLIKVETPKTSYDYDYDSSGRLVTISESNGYIARFEHTPSGRLARRSDTAGLDTSYEYDLAGRLVAITDAGARVVLIRDVDGRVVRAEDSCGRAVEIPCDPTGNAVTMRNIASLGVDDGLAINGSTTSLEWSGDGLLAGATDAIGAITQFQYDIAGRIRSATDPLGGVTSYEYDVAGRIINLVDPTGTNRPVSAFDEHASNRPKRKALLSTPRPIETIDGATFRRDSIGQLVEWRSVDDHVVRYTYDIGGRLTEESTHGGTTSYEYDAGGRLLCRVQADGATTLYRYDGQGRRTNTEFNNGTSVRYFWNASERLSRIARLDPQGTTTSYDWNYDELGLLVQVGDVDIEWTLRDGWPVVSRIGETLFEHTKDGVFIRSSDGPPRHVRIDGMGNHEQILDPWGMSVQSGVRLGYRGELCIDDLVWLHARVYDPSSRAFLTPDPLPNPPGKPCASNPYHYGWNDPVTNVDPAGLRPLTHEEFQSRTENESLGIFGRAWRTMTNDPWDGMQLGLVVSARAGLTFMTAPGVGLLVTSGSAAPNAVLNGVTESLSSIGQKVSSAGRTMWNAGDAAVDFAVDVNRTVGDTVWGVTRGVGRGLGDIAQGAWDTVMLSWHVSPTRWLLDRDGWQRDVDQFIAGIDYAVEHPLETLQQIGKTTVAWDTFAKGHYAEGVGESLVGIGSFVVGGKGLTKLIDGPPPAPTHFIPGVDPNKTKQLVDDLGVDQADDLASALGPAVVNDVLGELAPRDLASFVDELGVARFTEVQQRYGTSAMAHYGAVFFVDYQGITDDTMKHVVYGEGVTKDGVSGAHDRGEFLRHLQGRGEIIDVEDDPTRPGISQITYRLYAKDMTGSITDPPKLSRRSLPPKTVITDFASNAEQWRNEVNAAIDNAIRAKTFLPTRDLQDVETERFGTISLRCEPSQVKTFFPGVVR